MGSTQSGHASILVSAASLQGPRPYQEDRFVVSGGDGGLTKSGYLSVPTSVNCSTGSLPQRVLLGAASAPASPTVIAVFDGHGGAAVSSVANESLVPFFRSALGSGRAASTVAAALRSALASIEERCSALGSKAAKCGSTAAVLALTPQLIVAANLGDSRAVLVRRSAPRMPIALTLDDKPDRMDEKIRVEAAGGVSTPESARDCARVGHANVRFRLAMSRALGDFSLKLPSWVPKPILLSTPTLTAISLRPGDDELLIVASDGVWDVLTNEQACAVARAAIRRRLSGNDAEAGKRIPSPAEAIVDIALQRRSSDNCTCVVVEFDGARGSGEEEGERAALQEGGEADTVQVLGGLDASIFQREMLKMNGNPAAKL